MGRQSSITALPEEVRRWLERALSQQNFSGYEQLEEMVRDKGFSISKSAIHRHGQKIERRMAAIKASTEAAKMITEAAGDDQDARSEAVIALVQTEMFDSIIAIQEANDEELSASDRLGLMSKAAKNIATLARASIVQKKFKVEAEERIRAQLLAEQKEALDAMGNKNGVTEETKQAIRQVLGIA
jgi:hypothetical protein